MAFFNYQLLVYNVVFLIRLQYIDPPKEMFVHYGYGENQVYYQKQIATSFFIPLITYSTSFNHIKAFLT